MRGYSVIALQNPKDPQNIGGAMRAANCYGAKLVILIGERPVRLNKLPTDTVRAWRHTPHVFCDDIFAVLPFECAAVAVEFIKDGRSLLDYRHPERALYIFGPEDGSLDKSIINKCKDVVYVPTLSCMNLAVTVNVVLYDRMAKQYKQYIKALHSTKR